jgi:hypothetical protein
MKDSPLDPYIRLTPEEFWKAVEADKLECRLRVNRAAAEGRGVEEFHASLSLMGIDVTKPERPRLVSINGVRMARR